MRLVKTEGSHNPDWEPILCDHRGEEYAILSHRWAKNPHHEVLFADIEIIDDGGEIAHDVEHGTEAMIVYNSAFRRQSPREKPGYQKLRGAAQLAARDGYRYIWVDTCCIDKSSSAELSEAINSMWKWYRDSSVCYAYLEDVRYRPDPVEGFLGSKFGTSEWWTRGWTLQELLAPANVAFCAHGWEIIGHKDRLHSAISSITGIEESILKGQRSVTSVSVAKRMSWASNRRTTRPEDAAYCLMGLFDVNMPLLYGEGGKAFLRLQREIMSDSDDDSIFAWFQDLTDADTYSGMLAKHPSAFARSGDIEHYTHFEDREPYVMSNRGLSITVHLSSVGNDTIWSATLHHDTYAAALNCVLPGGEQGYLAVYLQKIPNTRNEYVRVRLHALAVVEDRGQPVQVYVRQSPQVGVLEKSAFWHAIQLRLNPSLTLPLTVVHIQGHKYDGPSLQNYYNVTNVQDVAQRWVPSRFPSIYKLAWNQEPSVAVLLADVVESERNILILLGSSSDSQVAFDAYEGLNLLSRLQADEALEISNHTFDPHEANMYKELESYQITVRFHPIFEGNVQIFIADITISGKADSTVGLDSKAQGLLGNTNPTMPHNVTAEVNNRLNGAEPSPQRARKKKRWSSIVPKLVRPNRV